MPKIRQKAEEYAAADFLAEINAQCGRFGLRSQKSLGDAIGVCQTTAGNYLRNPDSIPLGVMRALVKAIKPNPVIVLKAIGYSAKEISPTTKNIKGIIGIKVPGAIGENSQFYVCGVRV